MKILVIEDERLLADSLKELLEKKGFEVEIAYDGEVGRDYAETGIYDLLILDVMMPKMDGYEVAKKVRASRCTTPILMLTAKSAVEDRIYGLNCGADYWRRIGMIKPPVQLGVVKNIFRKRNSLLHLGTSGVATTGND